MSKKLVIVESPAKARTISGFLGPDYVVESSIGHVRDLPRSAADVPASVKGEPWARLGVDTENDFKPLYVVPKDKKKQITKLRRLVKEAEELLLATDEDREGESIAWHLSEVLNAQIPTRRMVFHEITPKAIEAALQSTRDLDRRLVDAQEARRILDRLVGYEVSPVLWKMVQPKLSAGRVQSPAIRLIVQRERERMEFTAGSYWDIAATFVTEPGESFGATLISVDGTRVATGKDFDATGRSGGAVLVLDQATAGELAGALRGQPFSIDDVTSKPYSRSPYPPFRTSTLQQEAARKLRFSAQRAMSVAQRLYENGYITYMRTDSVSLSETAISAARSEIVRRYGSGYVPEAPRTYKGKVKAAQEAHEAIRPAGETFRDPAAVAKAVGSDEARLYDLIWKRTIASQMRNAKGLSVQVRIGGEATDQRRVIFATSGKVIQFPGFLRAYVEGSDDPDAELEDQERRLPAIEAGDAVTGRDFEPKGHETKPPARFTEASLVKRLEELGIGRPSTYAAIIGTIQDRGYVWKKGTALVPSFTAFATVTLLEQHFGDLVDYEFTARMEDDLDAIAAGDRDAIPWLSQFYFGNGHPGLKKAVSEGIGDIDVRQINSIPLGEDPDGVPMVARVGRYGPFVQRGDDTASIPDDLAPDELSVERALELLSRPSGGERVLGHDPESGLEILVLNGRYGPYVQLGRIEEGSNEKPKRASVFSSMDSESIDLDAGLRLLSLPRLVGTDDEGNEITAQDGRYGPYLKRSDGETRSLETQEQIFTVTAAEARAMYTQPKRRRGASSAAPLRELGIDPETGCAVVVKNGRFGPYVTDGSVNASLRKGDAIESITIERASELLGDRRARMVSEGKKVKPCPKVEAAD